MILSPRQLASTLMEMTSEGSSVETLVSRTISFLKRKKKLSLLPSVLTELQALQDEKENICHVVITSAFSLSDELKKQVEEKAKTLFVGKNLRCEYVQDACLVGGIVISSAERRWDASVQKKMQALKNSL